jgi:hypothetical protein
MKRFALLCAGLLFIAPIDLPIGYYTFLRIIVTIGAFIIINIEIKAGINCWVILFVIVLLLFNPIFPIYLHDKNIWLPIDITSGILFLIKAIKTEVNLC